MERCVDTFFNYNFKPGFYKYEYSLVRWSEKDSALSLWKYYTNRAVKCGGQEEEILLIDYIDEAISSDQNIVEKDRWTIWIAVK